MILSAAYPPVACLALRYQDDSQPSNAAGANVAVLRSQGADMTSLLQENLTEFRQRYLLLVPSIVLSVEPKVCLWSFIESVYHMMICCCCYRGTFYDDVESLPTPAGQDMSTMVSSLSTAGCHAQRVYSPPSLPQPYEQQSKPVHHVQLQTTSTYTELFLFCRI